MAILYGPDVSSNQPKNIFQKIPFDFGIVKVSGNPQKYSWNYVNPYAAQQAKDAYNKTGCLGLYHFTWGKDAKTEADFFISEVKKLGYLNKAMLIIDYEAEAVDLGRNWVKQFADRIKEKAGYAPVIYASGGVIISQNLFALGYPIWCANYYKGYDAIYGYNTSGLKIYSGCEKSILWQYTSEGYIDGYDGSLDCNVFFGSKSDWNKYIGKTNNSSSTPSSNSNSNSNSNKKSIATIAQEVIDGKWGTGSDRKKKLTAAGYDYNKVQNKVNDIIYTNIAKEVINGKWGNGITRKNKLEAAGYNYQKVQDKVNSMLK